MVVVEVINFIFSSFLIFFNFSMFYALKKFKELRSKEENLFLEKTLFTCICFTYYIFLSIFIVLEILENDRDFIIYKIQEYLFNIYILSIYLINLFMSLELFFTYKNPIHYYLIIFNKKSRKIYEIIILAFIVIFLVINIFDIFGDRKALKIADEEEIKNYSTPFLLLDKWKWIVLLGSNITSLVFNFRLIFLISKFDFEKKDKLKGVVKKKLISNFCYLIYPFYNLILVGVFREKENPDYSTNKISIIIGSFIIFIILIIDTIIDLFLLSTTKFSQYKLRKTLVGYFAYIFPNDFEETIDILDSIKLPKRHLSNSDDDEEDEDEEEEKEEEENEAEVSLLPKCPKDTELVSIFKNHIFFEDYFMSFCDQYLNILTATLFKMYNSKLFSIKSVENKKIKEEMGGISISGIGGIGNASSTREISATAEETDNSSSFTFHKKKGKNHFAAFKNIFELAKEDIKVKITSYYTDNCVMNIKKSNLFSKKIASSLVSHYIIGKKEDKDNPNNFWSLTSTNAKEEYFRNMKNISFKTYDKNFNFDFFETDDKTISETNDSNKNIAFMINQYFDYIENGKGKTGTFLPELIGIFKIKINNFDTMLLFVSRNSIVNNVPKNFYTYWQLIRLGQLKPQKVATSKYNRNALVTEEPLFEKLYATDIKRNKDMNKVMLKNYADFKEILENDLNFFKQNNLLHVNLLMMYFEYENTQKHEKEGAIKIRKTDANEAEIINVDMPTDQKTEEKKVEKKIEKKVEKTEEKKEEITETKGETKESDNLNENIDENFNINANNDNGEIAFDEKDDLFGDGKVEGDDMFGDEGFDYMPDLGKDAHNLLDYTEKININGYEGNFDNFICLCFFTFENAFDLNNKSKIVIDESFKNKILENFSELKTKE